MKKLHFCTTKMLKYIKNHYVFISYRTGFVPNIYENDIIKIVERKKERKKNYYIMQRFYQFCLLNSKILSKMNL